MKYQIHGYGDDGKLALLDVEVAGRHIEVLSATVLVQRDEPTLEWTTPMTSQRAARYLLTGGFVAVELYRVTLKRSVAAAQEVTQLQTARKMHERALKESETEVGRLCQIMDAAIKDLASTNVIAGATATEQRVRLMLQDALAELAEKPVCKPGTRCTNCKHCGYKISGLADTYWCDFNKWHCFDLSDYVCNRFEPKGE